MKYMLPNLILLHCISCTLQGQVVLYDVTFDSPEHTVGKPPALDFGPIPRFGPTLLNQGNAPDIEAELVVEEFIGLERPVEIAPFDPIAGPACGNARVTFQTNDIREFDFYRAKFSVARDGFFPDFTAFFDSPQIHSLRFNAEGEVSVDSVFIDNTVVESYSTDRIYSVETILNDRDDMWTVKLDGLAIYEGPAQINSLPSLRLASTSCLPDVAARTFVDNVLIEGVVFGDVNQDGIVSLQDVRGFVELLTSGSYSCEADINLDGVVDLLDVGPFVDLLSS